MTRCCPHCGVDFEAADKGPGLNRRYCSENCRKRRCEQSKRAACMDCGAVTAAGSVWRGVRRCTSCYAALQAERAWPNRRAIELMWGDGFPLREIAKELGWTVDRLGVEMVRMRSTGWDLPFRYDHTRREAAKAGRLASA